MDGVPVIGRLSLPEYIALLFGFLFLAFEVMLRVVVSVLPKAVITWFYDQSRALFHFFAGESDLTPTERILSKEISKARDFGELCSLFGYTHEEHVALTKVCSSCSSCLSSHNNPRRMGFYWVCIAFHPSVVRRKEDLAQARGSPSSTFIMVYL